MPIYEYHCENCGQDFEALVMNSGQADRMQCESCGSEQVVRKVSAIGSCGSTTGTVSGFTGCGGGSGFS